MKKTIFGFIFAIALCFAAASCNNNATEATEVGNDTTMVAGDSVAVDSAAVVDTMAVEEVK